MTNEDFEFDEQGKKFISGEQGNRWNPGWTLPHKLLSFSTGL